MISSVNINNQIYKIDSENSFDIAIALEFNGEQPNAYGVEKATSTPCATENLIGDTRRGGSCNFEQIKLIPHCNGTHTECVGHITHERISIHDCLKDAFVLATLITVEPETAAETNETYATGWQENDRLITKRGIENALQNPKSKIQNPKFEGLIVRTLPNDSSKKTQTYLENIPPFFSTEAIEFIVQKQIKHLLVDMPSIDRIFDRGKLSNHRTFWNVEPESFEITAATYVTHTITEMIFVPDAVADGLYLLNLQIPAFVADAAPSRPVLFKFFE